MIVDKYFPDGQEASLPLNPGHYGFADLSTWFTITINEQNRLDWLLYLTDLYLIIVKVTIRLQSGDNELMCITKEIVTN